MNEYEKRGSILLEQGIISDKTYVNSIKVLEEISKQYCLDESRTSLIMHVIMCLQRAYTNTQLNEENAKLKEELKQTIGYEESIIVLKDVQRIASVELNESEKEYMLMHLLCLISEKTRGGSYGSD